MWINGLLAVLVVSIFCGGCGRSYAVATQTADREVSLRKELRENVNHVNDSRDIKPVREDKLHEDEIARQTGKGKHIGYAKKEYKTHKKQGRVHEGKPEDTRKPYRGKIRQRKRESTQKYHAGNKHFSHEDKTFETHAKGTRKIKRHKGKRKPVTYANNKLERKKNDGDESEKVRVNKTQKLKGDSPHRFNEDEKGKQNVIKVNMYALHNRRGDEDKKYSKNRRLPKKTLESLRDVLLVHPFEVWKFKDRFQSMDDLGIHEAQLLEIIDNKWNKRLKHKLNKVLKGENIHLALIGGSNTAGGGLQEDEGGTEGVYFRVISDWWRKTVTPITGSHLKIRQIAMGGTASDFFQYCYKVYLQKNVDIVLLEMSVNDLKELPPTVNLSLPIEQLTRQLLEFPTQPAVIYVNLFSGRSYYQGCLNLEDFGQRLLSDLYNITTFSWRDAVCPMVDGKFRVPLQSCGVVCKDGHHINQLGHAHISLMAINLLRNLLLDSIPNEDEASREISDNKISLPQPIFISSPSKTVTSPKCWTTVSPNYSKKMINNSMDVGVMENFGFDYLHDKRIGGQCNVPRFCRKDVYSGWSGKDVGAALTLSFTVPALEHDNRRLRRRSVIFATRTCQDCGAADVWLDDDYPNRRSVNARSNFFQTLLEVIALRVDPGDHTMSVHMVGPGEVTVVGVMLGPPDGPY